MKRSASSIEAGELSAEDIATLSYGWGNEGYSGDTVFLQEVVRRAAAASGPILECGSGLSTILMSTATRSNRQEVWSLEHYPQWAQRVRRWLKQYGARASTVVDAPLESYGDYLWYKADFTKLPRKFALVVCDGPPGDTRGGRYGLAPVMRERLAPGCVILLDDAERDAERRIADAWARELDASLVVEGQGHQVAILTLPS
jgi:predicted O-methyltransferase YrrM